MARMGFALDICFTACIFVTIILHANGSNGEGAQDSQSCPVKFEQYRTDTVQAIKKIFREEHTCSPCRQRFEDKVKIERLERRSKDFVTAMRATTSKKREARVPHPVVISRHGASVSITCESQGQPLSLCLWERQGKAVIIDQEVVRNGMETPVDGVTVIGGGLNSGVCSLHIQSSTADHIEPWTCTLVSQAGDVFIGNATFIKVSPPSTPVDPKIYFVTWKGRLEAYKLGSYSKSSLASSQHGFRGIAYDFLNDRIYWSEKFKIYRGNRDGTGITTVLDTRGYGTLSGLAFDPNNTRIFVVTSEAHVLACDAGLTQTFNCVIILTITESSLSSSQTHNLNGIALDPIEQTIYLTAVVSLFYLRRGGIIKAGFDGSYQMLLVEYLLDPYGIAIDFPSRRLYWAVEDTNKIQSSNFHGGDIETVVQLPGGSKPYGVAVYGNRIYWSTWGTQKLQSSTKSGADIRTHVENDQEIAHLALVADASILFGV